ncbi:hypothetical protein GCM10010515_76010 [Streptomyces fructofermentans]|uniref:Tape measure protein n=1 Tax=Streptomyces fructofermentans TaxID=152141 RepID=A0A918U690_9ACTN|nr:hypothetical protein GCM10010515_76010 [Streptomyces fructofermentans]
MEQRARVKVKAVADMTGFASDMQARLAQVRARVQVPVTPDLARFQTTLQAAVAAAGSRVRVPVDLDVSRAALAAAQAQLDSRTLRLNAQVTITREEMRRLRDGMRVPVTPDLARFQTTLQAAITSAGARVRVPVDLDISRAAIAAAQTQLTSRPLRLDAQINITREEIRRLRERLHVPVTPDLTRFHATLQAAITSAGNRVRVPIDVHVSRATLAAVQAQLARQTVQLTARLTTPRLELLRLRRQLARNPVRMPVQLALQSAQMSRLRRQLRDTTLRLPVGIQVTSREIRRVQAELARHRFQITVDIDRNTTDRIQRTLNSLGGAGGDGGGALSLLSLLPIRAAALASTAGGAIPAVASLVATIGQMAPAAGLGAAAMLSLVTATAALKIGTAGVGDALKNAFDPDSAEAYQKALAKLTPSARSFVTTIRGMKPQFDSLRKSVQERLFKGLDTALARTGKATLPLLRANLTRAAGALNTMGRKTLDTVTALKGPLNQGLKSATKGLSNLSSLPATVTQGIVQIGAAAGPAFERLTKAGGGAVERLSDRLTKSFESGAMEQAIERAIDLVGQLFDTLGNIREIFSNIFGPAAEAGGGFLGVLQDVTAEIAKVTATKGVQDALGALFETLALMGQTVAPLIGEALAALAPILTILGPPIQELVRTLGEALTPIIQGLQPVLEQAAIAFGELIIAALPLLELAGQLVVALLPSLVPLLQLLADVIRAVAPGIQIVAEGLGLLLIPVLGDMAQFIGEVVVPALQILIDLLRGDFASAQTAAADFTQRAIDSQVRAWSAFPGRVQQFTTQFMNDSIDSFRRAGAGMVEQVRGMLGNLSVQLARVPEIARGQLAGMAGVLNGAGQDLIRGFIDGIRSMIPSVQGVLGGLTSSLPDWKGPRRKDAKILTPAGRLLIQGFIKGIDGTTARLRQRLESITRALPSNVKSGYGRSLKQSTDQLSKLVKQRDSVIKRLADAEKKLKGLTKERDANAKKIREGILSDADITRSTSGPTTVEAITAQLREQLTAAKAFADQIIRLRKRSLRADLLDQLGQAGVEQGGAAATALAGASDAQLREVNRLQKQLSTAATKTGDTVANAMYASGVQAAKGLVSGLKNQKKEIEKTMVSIARAMQKALRTALGIASPAKKLIPDGINTVRGVLVGVDRERPRLLDAMASLVSLPATPSLSPSLAAAAATGGAGLAGQRLRLSVRDREFDAWLEEVADGRVSDALTTARRRSSAGKKG